MRRIPAEVKVVEQVDRILDAKGPVVVGIGALQTGNAPAEEEVSQYQYGVREIHLPVIGGIAPAKDDYESHRTQFMGALPADVPRYNEYHALIVKLGKDVCKKSLPLCQECPLQDVCITGIGGLT